MGAGDLADDTVGSQQPKQTCDPCGNTTMFFNTTADLRIKMGHKVPIMKTLQDELASADQRQKLLIEIGPGVQRSHVPTLPARGSTDGGHQLFDGDLAVQRSQSLQVAIIDRLTDFGPSAGIGDPFA